MAEQNIAANGHLRETATNGRLLRHPKWVAPRHFDPGEFQIVLQPYKVLPHYSCGDDIRPIRTISGSIIYGDATGRIVIRHETADGQVIDELALLPKTGSGMHARITHCAGRQISVELFRDIIREGSKAMNKRPRF